LAWNKQDERRSAMLETSENVNRRPSVARTDYTDRSREHHASLFSIQIVRQQENAKSESTLKIPIGDKRRCKCRDHVQIGGLILWRRWQTGYVGIPWLKEGPTDDLD
jgi:hypothetical protein